MLVLDLRKLETLTDYFVICTGDVDQHVRAIVEHIQKEVKTNLGERVAHREGMETMNWVLLDYVDVVVHVFKPSYREFYRLEDLWSDADTVAMVDGKEVAVARAARRRRVNVPVNASAAEEKPSKKTAAKKAAPRKPAAKAAPKQTAVKTPRKTAVKSKVPKIIRTDAAPKKSAAKKAAPAKPAPKKTAPKKAAPTKPAPKKAAQQTVHA